MQSQIHSTPELKLKQNKEQIGKKQIAMHENLFKLNYLWSIKSSMKHFLSNPDTLYICFSHVLPQQCNIQLEHGYFLL